MTRGSPGRLAGVEHHGRVREFRRIDRRGQEVQQRQPAPLEAARSRSPAHNPGGVQQVVAVDQKWHGEGRRVRVVGLAACGFAIGFPNVKVYSVFVMQHALRGGG